MATCIIFYLSIISGSIFAECILKKNFEDALPVSIGGIIFLQFFLGLLGNLALGFWLVIFLTFILYAITFVFLLRRGLPLLRSLKCVLASKGFWIFTGIYVGLVYALSTLTMRYGDEGSHWGPVVMVMTLLNDFGTNPLANLPFGNYVPGMSIFQYYIEKIYFILNGTEKFGDCYLYIAYHTLTAAYLTPLICKLKISKKFDNCIMVVSFMLIPLIFYRGDIFNLYQILQVDAAVGLLSGYALAMILVNAEEHNGTINIYMLSVCSVLSIIKTSGLLFSVIIMCTYIFCERTSNCLRSNSHKIYSCISFLGGVCSTVLPTILWNRHTRRLGGGI